MWKLYFARTMESVQCLDFMYPCMLQEPVTPTPEQLLSQVRTGKRVNFKLVKLPYQVDGKITKISRVIQLRTQHLLPHE